MEISYTRYNHWTGHNNQSGGRDDTGQHPMCITNIRANARCTLSFKAVSHSNPKKILRVYRDLNPRAFILPLVPILDECPLTLHKLWCHTLKTSGPRNSTIKAEASNLQCFIRCWPSLVGMLFHSIYYYSRSARKRENTICPSFSLSPKMYFHVPGILS